MSRPRRSWRRPSWLFVDLALQRAVAPGRPFWQELWHHVRVLYRTDDAHNTLLQVVVELGIPAGLAFIWLLVPAAASVWQAGPARHHAPGTLSWCQRWPRRCLLGLGLLVGHLPLREERSRTAGRTVAWGAVGAYLLSLTWRL